MKVKWPPKPRKNLLQQQIRTNYEGQPTLMPLHRYNHDRSLRGQMVNACCDCGLTHLLTFEVFQVSAGRFYMNKRAFRLEADYRPKQTKRRKK